MIKLCFAHLRNLIFFVTIFFVDQGKSVMLCPTATWQKSATTVAGDSAGTLGSNASTLYSPIAVRVDKNSNIYVLDSGNYRVQRFSPNSTIGTTIVNGSAGIAFNQFYNHKFVDDMSIDNSGNIYILDGSKARVTKWARGASSGVVVAGGNALGNNASQLYYSRGMFLDTSASAIWIADTSNHRIVKWTSPTSSMVVCGSRGAEDDQFAYPFGVFLDESNSNTLYVADTFNHRIQRWLTGAASGTTVAGLTGYYGNGLNQLWYPTSVTLDNNRNMFIVDSNNNRILQWAIGLSSGMIIAGDIYYGVAAYLLYDPMNIDFDSNGSLYVADTANNRIQKFLISCPPAQNISTTVSPATTSAPMSNTIWSLNGTTIAGSPTGWSGHSPALLTEPSDIAIERNGTLYVLDAGNYRVQRFLPGSTVGTTVVNGSYGTRWNQFYSMDAMSIDANGNMYIADSGNARVMKWSPGASNGTIAVGGNGNGNSENQFRCSYGIFIPKNSSSIWLADTCNHRIVRWNSSITGTTVCGSYRAGASQSYYPFGVFVDSSASNTLYVADTYNHRIQRWLSGATSGRTVAGQTGNCDNGHNQLCYPGAVVGDENGYIYIVDTFNDRIMRWMVGASYGTVVAGSSTAGVLPNQLYQPKNLRLDSTGAVLVVDITNNRIQKFALLCASCLNIETGVSTLSTNGSAALGTSTSLPMKSNSSVTTSNPTQKMTTKTAAGGTSTVNQHLSAWALYTDLHNRSFDENLHLKKFLQTHSLIFFSFSCVSLF
ncbi:unnamed protein product [Adineta ricciae]|uniref:NHL repeat containing protein n=1 Tax=Adineta ricciae TaxID=249248 RepID=A0A815AXQ1_ADIRI|nr:unnamed protein product [Adineta ricciae]CAF1261557.1 unnamed protein product [Adineta ricciae]